MRFTAITTTIAALALSACTTNPQTGQQEPTKAATYGAGAAVVCALIGAADSGKHARNAALGCGIAGAGIGAYMDAQERQLREQLADTGVSVQREGDHIELIIPDNITFAIDSYNLRSEFLPVLDDVAAVLTRYPDTAIAVTGHTDNTGSRQHNQRLSENRAASVADYLLVRNVSSQRMLVRGVGFDDPVADNSTSAGRAANRRVEIHILPPRN